MSWSSAEFYFKWGAATPSKLCFLNTFSHFLITSFLFIGGAIGNFVGGIIYENYGARMLFRCNGALCLVSLLIFFFFTVFVLKKKESRDGADEDAEKDQDKCNMKGNFCYVLERNRRLF